jgi:hypothetical protein
MDCGFFLERTIPVYTPRGLRYINMNGTEMDHNLPYRKLDQSNTFFLLATFQRGGRFYSFPADHSCVKKVPWLVDF